MGWVEGQTCITWSLAQPSDQVMQSLQNMNEFTFGNLLGEEEKKPIEEGKKKEASLAKRGCC